MTVDLDKLMKQIEELRRELHLIAEQKEMSDSEVVKASQKLDVALNEYYHLLNRKKSPPPGRNQDIDME